MSIFMFKKEDIGIPLRFLWSFLTFSLGIFFCSFILSLFFYFGPDLQTHLHILAFFLGNTLIGFTQTEISHMQDVRVLLYFGIMLLGVGLLTTQFTKKTIHTYSKVFISLGAFLFFSVLLFFERTFILFHEIAFTNDDWLLPASSKLILTYSSTYFFWISLLFFGLSLCISVTTYCLTRK